MGPLVAYPVIARSDIGDAAIRKFLISLRRDCFTAFAMTASGLLAKMTQRRLLMPPDVLIGVHEAGNFAGRVTAGTVVVITAG